MVSVGRHPNIKLLTYSEIEFVSGYVGNYQINLAKTAVCGRVQMHGVWELCLGLPNRR